MKDAAGLTLEDANKRLPLVRAISRDAKELKADILMRLKRLQDLRSRKSENVKSDSSNAEEILQVEESIEEDEIRIDELGSELEEIGAHLMDAETGLVEFSSTLDGEEIRLSWLFDEAEVTHWRSLNESPANRKPLVLIGQESA